MTAKPWMPLYIADYLADTGHLGAYESGAYLHLIMHQWQCGALPTDERALCRIAKVHPPHWPRIRAVLAPFFGHPKTGGSWVQKRTALEQTKAGKISNERKAAALQMHSKRAAIAEQMHAQPQSQLQNKRATPDAPVLISPEAFHLAGVIASLCGHDPSFLPSAWAGAPLTIQGWLDRGWTAQQIEASCREKVARKQGAPPECIGYFERGVADFVARLAAPVPTATPTKGEPRDRGLTPHQRRLKEHHDAIEQYRRDRGIGRGDDERPAPA